MSLSELQNTVLRLVEKDSHVREALHQVWKEKERETLLRKSVKWTATDWLEARIHFEPIIQDELKQCAECVEDRYEAVYHLLNQTEEWTSYLRNVRASHSRLPALQDEIAKAKL